MKELLLWEKWRPKKIEDCSLPQRITNHFKDGLNGNYIFYGGWGVGKTSLAKILIGKWSGESAFLEINSSLYTSIETLRGDVEKFCRTVPMFGDGDQKYVFLDEFERVSPQYQDALKAFIEEYASVRFILSTNHFNKISDGVKSRFTHINFNTLNRDEEREVKISAFKRLKYISESEGILIETEQLKSLVNRKFPDIRSMLVALQNISGGISSDDSGPENLVDLTIKMLETPNLTYDNIYHFIYDNFGDTKIDKLFQILSRDLTTHSLNNGRGYNLFSINKTVVDYWDKLDTRTDPLILGMAVVGLIREFIQTK